MFGRIFGRFRGLLALGLISSAAFANNVQVSNISTAGLLPGSGTTQIIFDLSWENSWHDNHNFDAVWVFAKYRVHSSSGGHWYHANLDSSGHFVPAGIAIDQPSNKGVFIRRSTVGGGDMATSGIQVRWPYATQLKSDVEGDFLTSADAIELEIHAIEMVYVPQGAFDLGDGKMIPYTAENQLERTVGNLHRADSAETPYRVTSEDSITLGGTSSNALCSTSTVVYYATPEEDFSPTVQKTLPATFPKGYNGFYMMKYETTQEQYVAFLNSLRREQQLARVRTVALDQFSLTGDSVAVEIHSSKRVGIRAGQPATDSAPYPFYCDFNRNGVAGDYNDGQTLAVAFVTKSDVAAYLDWACLRPMTEFEFEKACRGPLPAIPGEFPWGTTNMYYAGGDVLLGTEGRPDERPYSPISNMSFNTAIVGMILPHRVGMFARSNENSNRESAGATFYGAMDMAGNTGEAVISISTPTGRAYTGLHGDGTLSSTGFSDVPGWPADGAEGWGRKGMSVVGSPRTFGHNVSTRDILINDTYVDNNRGIRGVMTFPLTGEQP